MKYDAFISYRHTPLDMEIAKKVHVGLETFKVPVPVKKKTGKNKIERVFRDQEELPIGSDLNDNISGALANSEWLIVICSPRTPESYWVCKEIETFIKMHDREHVLAVLVEGEPDESFPKLLLSDEDGNPVEPLAADVRGENKAIRNKKFKTEILRLAAPVLGCSYDDLRQRHKERIMKKRLTTAAICASAVAVCGVSFGIYNAAVARKMSRLADEKQQLADDKTRLADEILVQYKDKQINQSKYLAKESKELLENGDRKSAVKAALEGLPGQEDRPYVPESEYALANALYAYDSGGEFGYDRGLEHKETVKEMYLSSDGAFVVSTDYLNNVYVWDDSTWECKSEIAGDGCNVVYANADKNGIYVVTEDAYVCYGFDAKEICRYDSDENINAGEIVTDKGVVVCICNNSIRIVDIKSGEEKKIIPSTMGTYSSGEHVLSEDKKYLAVSYYVNNLGAFGTLSGNEKNDGKLYFDVLNLDDNSVSTVAIDGSKIDSPDIKGICFTGDGKMTVLFGDGVLITGVKKMGLALVDVVSKKTVWTKIFESDIDSDVFRYKILLKTISYKADSQETTNIVVGLGKKIYTFNQNRGEIVMQMMVPSTISELNVVSDSSYGRVACRDGNIYAVDFAKGSIMEDVVIETGKEIYDVMYVDRQIVLMVAKEPALYIMSEHKAGDMKELVQTDADNTEGMVSDDGSCFVIKDEADINTYYFYDMDGKLIYTFDKEELSVIDEGFADGKFVCVSHSEIWVVDPKKGEEKCVDNITTASISNASLSNNAKYCVMWSFNTLAVIDVLDGKCIFETKYEGNIKNAVVSSDAKNIYVYGEEDGLKCVDTNDGSEKKIKDDKMIIRKEDAVHDFIVMSDDDKYLAMYCADGNVRIVDTSSGITSVAMPLAASNHLFMQFIDKGLLLQGSDYTIKIWDMAKSECVSSYEADYGAGVKYVIESKEKTVACTGFVAYVFENQSYGCVARVPDARIYIADEDAFVCGGRTLSKVCYKNWKALIEEAHRQFED